MDGNGKKLRWAAGLSLTLNVLLFGYVSLGFFQGQGDRERRPVERDLAGLQDKTAAHDEELKAIAVSLEGIRQQLVELREDVREIKDAVK